MLLTAEQVTSFINEGKLLHISGAGDMLAELPAGNWIGGSTEYFMAAEGGKVTNKLLYVTELPYTEYSIKTYDESNIRNLPKDAYANGFTILIIPFDTAVHNEYAKHAAEYEDLFLKNIVGWISGVNLGEAGQTPVAVNGRTTEVLTDSAVALHISLPVGKNASVNILNIFEPNENSPVINFTQEGFTVGKCLINGKESNLAEYVTRSRIDTNLPLIGDYSGSSINISFRSIENGIVNLYAPVYSGIDYRFAKNIDSYAEAFNKQLRSLPDGNIMFSCNCILNFLYGELEGKKIEKFHGPITFGEIAYQLVNQTLVYVTVN